MYTGVNDIMRLDRGPRSTLDEDLLAASLKALTTDQFLAELVVPPTVCEPIYMNQVLRTALLAAMATLDDVDIAPMQRGNLSHGMVILRASGLGSAAGGCGRGGGLEGGRGGILAGGRGGGLASGGPAGGRVGGPVGGRGGATTGDQGGNSAGGSDPAPSPGKGKDKQVQVVLDDDEVSFDEDVPLQKRLLLSSSAGGSSGSAPSAPDVAAVAKAVADKEVVMEVTTDKEATDN
jgi:hypothetical protein